jgi:predicted nucleotidyltransferase
MANNSQPRIDGSQISSTVLKVLKSLNLQCVEIAVFGSRVDPFAKGGDIDLYIRYQRNPHASVEITELKLKLKIALEDSLGEQKIDLVLDDGEINLGSFFDIINETKGVIWTSKSEKIS